MSSARAPTIDEMKVVATPAGWESAGFRMAGDAIEIGTVRIRLAAPDAGRGIVGCSMRRIATERPDGLPISRSPSRDREPVDTSHPNGATSLDHLVAFSSDLDRTVAALEEAGLELRRLREEPTPGGAPRQAFFRLAETILEVVERPPGSHEADDAAAPARFWGFAFCVRDIDRCAALLGERLGAPHDAVQPGRRIATLRRDPAVGAAVAFMTPDPRRAG